MAGLGNQMFQYALYSYLKNKGFDTSIDTISYQNNAVHSVFELCNVFELQPSFASEMQIRRLRRYISDMSVSQRIVRKTRLLLHLHWKHIPEKQFYVFNPNILNLKHAAYLDGYWQTEKYFKPIEQVIRKDFTFRNPLDKKNKALLLNITKTNSISIHIRRGDYVNHALHGNICNENYYKIATNYIQEKTDNPVFFVFSDDPNWCKKHLHLQNSTFIDWNTGRDSYRDMQLMSHCKHNIIANSSFSWWAAWLNINPDKIVIGPDRWVNTTNNNPMLEEWVSIPV